MPIALEHWVSIVDPHAHLIEVTLRARAVADARLPDPLTVFMPVWTPGSYLVREHARNVEGMSAEGGRLRKIRKNAWQLSHGGRSEIAIRYRVYCSELSVRTNHVDATHAFLNGAATFLGVEGCEDLSSTVVVECPDGWETIVPLPEVTAPEREPRRAGTFLRAFVAPDFESLVDAPIELGLHRTAAFEALGVGHRCVAWPADAVSDDQLARLAGDARKIVEQEARVFGGTLPYRSYVVYFHLVPRGRGGLEHASSAAIVASPASVRTREGYLDLLSLVAHELFHAWNVKRIRPAGLVPCNLQGESYTRLLWWFEGATSYYDWLVLRRAGLCSVTEYLDHLSREMSLLQATVGRNAQSLEEASFDAWIKAYRPDENTPNTAISYYRKGEIVCAMLDLALRARSAGKASLDTVFSHLWEHFGRTNTPFPEDGMGEAFRRATGVDVEDLLDAWVRKPGEVEYADVLGLVGLEVARLPRNDAGASALGLRLAMDDGRVVTRSLARGGAAQRAGLDAGDELISVAGRRLESTSLDAALFGIGPGTRVEVIATRDGRTRTLELRTDEPPVDRLRIQARADASAQARAAFEAWLGQPHPQWSSS